MTTFAVSMVKDEADVIAGTILHMADEVDHLIVADNRSTDGTREILAELEDLLPLTVVDDGEVGYYQSKKMTHLAEMAADRGADWIVPFDADELWTASERIRDVLAASHADIVTAALFDHFATAVDPPGVDPFETIVYRKRLPAVMPKVAFRWRGGAVIEQGNHAVTMPGAVIEAGGLEIRHFPFRSADQFVRKARNGAAAYRATNLPLTEGAHWRQYGDLMDALGVDALKDVYREWFWMKDPPYLSDLVLDPAPYLRWKRQ